MRNFLLVLFISTFLSLSGQEDVIYKIVKDSSSTYAYNIQGDHIEGFIVSNSHFRIFTGKRHNEYKISLFDAFTNEPLDLKLPIAGISDSTISSKVLRRYSDSSFFPIDDGIKSPEGKISLNLLLPTENNQSTQEFTGAVFNSIVKSWGTKMADFESLYMEVANRFQEQYMSSNKELFAQFGDECFACNWEKRYWLTPLFFDDHYLSFNLTEYAFTGGAHGMQHNTVINIDLKNGTLIQFEEIIQKENLQQLETIITRKIAEQKGIPANRPLSKAGFFNDTITPSKNFSITPYGIIFIYNPYEIAPYAMGIITVFISEKELEGVLIKNL